MYWRKLFDRENPNEKLEQKILDIRKKNKDFGFFYVLLYETGITI
jgi:putative transposase